MDSTASRGEAEQEISEKVGKGSPSRLRALSPFLLGLGFVIALIAFVLQFSLKKPLQPVNSVVDWRKFYIERYIYVGKLVGRYYDSQGNPTKYLKGVEAKARRGAQLLEKQKIEEAKIPSCNSRWSEQDGGKFEHMIPCGCYRCILNPYPTDSLNYFILYFKFV
ncbi:hypothetical protein COCNU_02G002870 [Cocos nucifera]|uniref:Uncharacterized protein n=1 Tax=Cocos nucifera TaxID=13894 RepID=A0A8K0MWM1_COCNU|nr:hypothetical protein COCNU_02G002870 [Cocos nucifera]